MINSHLILQFISHFFKAKRKGHGVHSPFAFELCEEVFYNTNSFYDFEALDKIREQLLHDEREIEMEDYGAGSKTFSSTKRKIKDIARRGISTQKQSELLYRLINYLECATCIELGTSLGLNTLYLAMACKTGSVTSIEGSPALYKHASALAQEYKITNIRFILAQFDKALPEVLSASRKIDFLYIDGNHTFDATCGYFELALPKLTETAVVVLDDIYWSKGMTEAWKKITQHSSVTLSIDAFYFGLVFFRKEIKEKTTLRIYI